MTVKIEWDALCYADRLPNVVTNLETKAAIQREESIQQQYPLLKACGISKPCIICDMQGIILTWYLPGILNGSRQVGPFIIV